MKYKVNEEFFEKWTPAMAWVLGVIVADGNVYKSQNRFKVSMKDKDILEKIRTAMDSTHRIYKFEYNSSWTGRKTFIYEFVVARKKMVNNLIELGICPNKSKTISFPKVPKKYLSHFIRGLFDGDGNVSITVEKGYRRVRPRFYTGSIKFAEGLKEKLVSLNIPTNIQPHHGLWSVNVSNKLWDWMYNNKSVFFGKRKYSLVEGEPIR